MPQNKLQHYVPKCHLRPFCSDPQGFAVNLYNISRDRLIKDAPIKGQCARNYFYGEDGLLERALQEPESAYGAIVAKARSDTGSITSKDLAFLREFTLLQTFRSYGYAEKLMAMSDRRYADLQAAAPAKPLPPRIMANVDQAVVTAVRYFVKTRKHIRDLETCLILNEAQREFITSDDPAIHTNRFHFQELRKDAFGLASAGAMFFLPLTPKLAFMAFDGNVYFPPTSGTNTVVIRNDDDVSPFNELQLLHARQNLYYANAATGEILVSEFRRHAGRRPKTWHEFSYFEKIGESDKGEHFQSVEAMMNLEPGRTFLSALQTVHVHPSRWTGLLEYRPCPRFVDTGTSTGCIRPDHPMLRARIERRTPKT
jgi:Protein of unknown function (DUF4238)